MYCRKITASKTQVLIQITPSQVQCLRLRRIINNNERLKTRLDELCIAFEKSGYPKTMLANITSKVINMQRRPTSNNIHEEETNLSNTTNEEQNEREPILVVSGYGTDEKLTKTLKTFENDILKTNTFKEMKNRCSNL